ncbi:MAG: SRPBCC family protein [Bacteroidia bacterium]
MSTIFLTTEINAPIQRCFDLSRSIDLHKLSTSKTNEKAVAGVTTGLIGLHETVTWRAKHFGIYQTMETKITAFIAPEYFESSMVRGAFKSIFHKHIFEEVNGKTIMKDEFNFEAPFGFPGKIFSKLILNNYMKRLLEERNLLIKEVAESEQWKEFLK